MIVDNEVSECRRIRPGGVLSPGRILVLIVLALATAAMFASTNSSAESPAKEVAGTVRNTDGSPIANAWVTDGNNYTFSDNQGVFVFDSGKVVPGASLLVSSSGYQQEQFSAPSDGKTVDVVMNATSVRGLYFNPNISYNQQTIDSYIQIARTTEVNAVVIDVKENVVYFDTDVELFHEANMVVPFMDLEWLLNEFQSAGIYTIARIVVFKDSPVAETFPEYAVRDSYTGGVWRDGTGTAWVNPLKRQTWDANISLAEEVIELGFDEVQYDYIRFPTDGNMARADFGREITAQDREKAIEDFLKISRDRLIPLGGRQSADVFGYTTVIDHDLGIGQNFSQVSETVDYVSPMIYPSHWPSGSLYGIPGHPNEYPYLTVQISMNEAIKQLDGNRLQIRPWLQDFGIYGQRTYGTADVRAQIDALNDVGIDSWLIWSFTNVFHVGAFQQDLVTSVAPNILPLGQPPAAPTHRNASRTWRTVSH